MHASENRKQYSSKPCDMTLVSPYTLGPAYISPLDDLVVDSFMPITGRLKRLSPVCSFEFNSENQYTNKDEISVTFSYHKTDYRPRIYQWNEGEKKWVPLKTLMNRTTLKVTADVASPIAIIGVFADQTDTYEGLASWYRHTRYPAGCATNVFPLGTKLRVTNTQNGKSTLVTVTSTWTQTDPRRALDLVSTAFQKIGNLKAGLISIRVEKIP